jgi:pyruvate kinase
MNNKQVQIVATIGPATHTERMILELAKAGVDIFRINLSHAKPNEIIERTKWIRNAEQKLNRTLFVLGDLPGPKIRIGEIVPNTVLEQGHKFIISKKIIRGDKFGCSINFPSIINTIQPGAEVFIDDGNIKLLVESKTEEELIARVIVGGVLKSRKGFSGQGISLNHPKLLEKDKDGIRDMIAAKADMIAVSFVETKNDILAVKELLPKNTNIKLIAKIETENGVRNSKEILQESDGLMIARGDLGLAVPLAKVPHMQKELIRKCIKRRKFVITATHMLESMVTKPLPTRAEVSDVANAVLDGTKAVMLSAETAEGKFPVETVKMMSAIIDEALKYRSSLRVSYVFNLIPKRNSSLKI